MSNVLSGSRRLEDEETALWQDRKFSSNYQVSLGYVMRLLLCMNLCLFAHSVQHTLSTVKWTSDENQSSSTSFIWLRQQLQLQNKLNVNKCDIFAVFCRLLFFFGCLEYFYFCVSALKIIFIMLIHIMVSNAFLSLSHGTRGIIFNVHALDFIRVVVGGVLVVVPFIFLFTFFWITLKISPKWQRL